MSDNKFENVKKYGEQCIKDEAEALFDLIPQIDDNFVKAVEMMIECRGKVIVTGVGKSGHIGAKIFHGNARLFHQSTRRLPWRPWRDD